MSESDLREKIYFALADPKAPWYGSDLIEWVDDFIKEQDSFKKQLIKKLSVEKTETEAKIKAQWKEIEDLEKDLNEYREDTARTYSIVGDIGLSAIDKIRILKEFALSNLTKEKTDVS